MRKFSKHTPEQIVVKLEKAEALRGEGIVVGRDTFRRLWRAEGLLAPAQSPQAPHCAAPAAPGRG